MIPKKAVVNSANTDFVHRLDDIRTDFNVQDPEIPNPVWVPAIRLERKPSFPTWKELDQSIASSAPG